MAGKKRKIFYAVLLVFLFGTISVILFLIREKKSGAEFSYEPLLQNQDICPQESPTPVTGAPEPRELFVHVCGAVKAEGVYALPEGSRGTDAVEAAGGFNEDADESFLNLAARLTDGQKLYIPTISETKDVSPAERSSGQKAEEKQKTDHFPVNLNTATLSQLMTLNGIGEAKGNEILKYRQNIGNFRTTEEIMNVPGIGEALYERIKNQIVAE